MKFLRPVLLCLLLAACDSMPVSDNQASFDSAKRQGLMEKALAGDANAQYELGNSYCCGEHGFWNTKQAITWWCKAAATGHPRAKAKLLQYGGSC